MYIFYLCTNTQYVFDSDFKISASCCSFPNMSSCTWQQTSKRLISGDAIPANDSVKRKVRGEFFRQANMGEERQDPSGGLMYNQFL